MPTVEIPNSACNLLINHELEPAWLCTPAPVASNFRAKPICTEEILYGADLCTWRGERGNHLALIAPVSPKIVLVYCDDDVAGKQFTHANQAQVSQIGFAILVTPGKLSQLFEVSGAIKSHPKHFILQQGKDVSGRSQMKRSLRQRERKSPNLPPGRLWQMSC